MVNFLLGFVTALGLVFIIPHLRQAFSGAATAFKSDMQAMQKEVESKV